MATINVGVNKNIFSHSIVRQILSVLGAVFLLAVSAQISIPLVPVPLSFQSITVLAMGVLMGARLGSYSVMGYLLLGAAGMPVFENFSGGLPIFFGPTAGYLFGFLPAVWIAGYLSQKGFFKSGIVIGTLIIFALGFIGLSLLIGMEKAWLLGIKPFLVTEFFKIMILMILIKPIIGKSKSF